MTRWVLVAALLAAGCTTMETTRFVAPVLSGPADTDPAQLRRDERDCEAYALERPSETRYGAYVACMVSRGHRTYASLVARQAATGVTVQSAQKNAASDVYRNLEQCARTARVRVDMPPHPDAFRGARAEAVTLESQRPFAECLNAAGYSTTLHATPEAVAMATMPPPPPPGPVIAAPAERAPAAAPPTPPPPGPPAAPGRAPSPPPVSTPGTPALAPAPPAAVAVVPPASTVRAPRPVKLGLYVEPGSKPPVVKVVAADTPAGRAGVRAGDVVLRIDGRSIGSENDIAAVLATKAPDDVVRIDLRRGNQEVSVNAILSAP
jgi:hypothetical protein